MAKHAVVLDGTDDGDVSLPSSPVSATRCPRGGSPVREGHGEVAARLVQEDEPIGSIADTSSMNACRRPWTSGRSCSEAEEDFLRVSLARCKLRDRRK